MNILFISPIVPFPPVDGDRQRAYHLLRRLARSHRVRAVCFVRGEQDRAGLEHLRTFCAGAEGVEISALRIRLNSLAAWPGRLPLNVAAFASGAMAARVRRIAAQEAFDVAHAYRLRSAPYALQARARWRVLDYTDALTRYFDARIAEPGPWWKRAYLRREAERLRKYEVRASRNFDACLISSPSDREVLRQAGAAETLSVVTNGVDTAVLRPAQLTLEPRLLFVGNMEYVPNAAGLRAFCRETWPRIRAELPAAELTVVGRPPAEPPAERARRYPGAEFAGVVPDLPDWFHRARVAICPLPVAAGRQFKVIEAFAAGVPVVATRVVAENLGAIPDRHLLVADGAVEFAAQAIRLCRDPALAERLRRQARSLAEEQYDWSRAGEALDQVYRALEMRGSGRKT
jgi:polysaccharide biosynthesis protein PslH